MPYEVKESHTYPRPATEVAAAAIEVAKEIQGKLGKTTDAAKGHVEATFNKSVAGKAFGNRVTVVIQVIGHEDGCAMALEAFPVDPLGKKLLFGVMGDPARLVTDALIARLNLRLKG